MNKLLQEISDIFPSEAGDSFRFEAKDSETKSVMGGAPKAKVSRPYSGSAQQSFDKLRAKLSELKKKIHKGKPGRKGWLKREPGRGTGSSKHNPHRRYDVLGKTGHHIRAVAGQPPAKEKRRRRDDCFTCARVWRAEKKKGGKMRYIRSAPPNAVGKRGFKDFGKGNQMCRNKCTGSDVVIRRWAKKGKYDHNYKMHRTHARKRAREAGTTSRW